MPGLATEVAVGVGFTVFDFKGVSSVTGRADGGIVGAQASGDARALRRLVDFSAWQRWRTVLAGGVLLPCVQHVDYLDDGRLDTVHDDVVGVHYKLAGAGNAPRAVQIGVLGQLRGCTLDLVLQLVCSVVIALGDVFDDGGQVVTGLRKPLNRKHWVSGKSSIGPVFILASRLVPGGVHFPCCALFGNDFAHFCHHLVMGNAGARIIERGLHLGAEPAVIAGRLLFGFEFRDDWGEDGVHSFKVTPL